MAGRPFTKGGRGCARGPPGPVCGPRRRLWLRIHGRGSRARRPRAKCASHPPWTRGARVSSADAPTPVDAGGPRNGSRGAAEEWGPGGPETPCILTGLGRGPSPLRASPSPPVDGVVGAPSELRDVRRAGQVATLEDCRPRPRPPAGQWASASGAGDLEPLEAGSGCRASVSCQRSVSSALTHFTIPSGGAGGPEAGGDLIDRQAPRHVAGVARERSVALLRAGTGSEGRDVPSDPSLARGDRGRLACLPRSLG